MRKPANITSEARIGMVCTGCDELIIACDAHKEHSGDVHYFEKGEDLECNDGFHYCKDCSEAIQNEDA